MAAMVEHNEINIVSANCSFVTTFPGGLAPFPASDNIAMFKFLMNDPEIKTVMLSANFTKEEIGGKINYNINKNIEELFIKKLQELFLNSISLINNNLSETKYYSAAGLQELNNTTEVEKFLSENNKYLLSNVYEGYSRTYPTLGYIFPKNFDFSARLFRKIKGIEPNKVFTTNSDNKTGTYSDVEDKSKCSSLITDTDTDSLNYMAIRDLGIDRECIFAGKNYRLMKTETSPDAGRPISMIIIKGEKGQPPIIHLNCHMPNPSLLKIFEGDSTYVNPTKTILTRIQEATEQTLKDALLGIWIKYCKESLESTITEMLSEFELIDLIDLNNVIWIINGDFNDGYGELMKHLQNTGITILNKPITFNFGKLNESGDLNNLPKTCCLNTNSANNTTTGTIISQNPFNRNYSYLAYIYSNKNIPLTEPEVADKQILDTNFLIDTGEKFITNQNFAFHGDTIGIFSKITSKITPDDITKIENQSSDHSFVERTIILSGIEGGKSKKRRVKNASKKTQKRRRSIKKHRKSRK